MPQIKNKYDAVIIGAGVSGLVCGCYLAKGGMKVLIVEKNSEPGGYCSSFTRDGFTFDACVHSLGSLKKDGIVAKALKDLQIDKRIKIKRYNPSDIIITSDIRINFWNDSNKAIQEFQGSFPKEAKNLTNFFEYLNTSQGVSQAQLRNLTFKDLLDSYFSDNKLKAILALFVLGNIGLPASLISAFIAVKFYKQFILDGGYYPDGAMQTFSDILATRFKEFGGDLLLSHFVKTIRINDNKTEGIVLEENNFISSKYVISDCDATQTFVNLIGEKITGKDTINRLNSLIPSLSMFILYLGVDNDINTLPQEGVNIWFLPNYNIEDMYIAAKDRRVENVSWFMVRVMPDKKSILVFVNAPFKNREYWHAHKEKLVDGLIKKTEYIIPDLSKHIIIKDAATPNTLYRRTLNYRGAAYGWASLPSQFAVPGFSQITSIQNLYLTGHWTTLAQGIPGVVYLGRDTAKIILRREKKNA